MMQASFHTRVPSLPISLHRKFTTFSLVGFGIPHSYIIKDSSPLPVVCHAISFFAEGGSVTGGQVLRDPCSSGDELQVFSGKACAQSTELSQAFASVTLSTPLAKEESRSKGKNPSLHKAESVKHQHSDTGTRDGEIRKRNVPREKLNRKS